MQATCTWNQKMSFTTTLRQHILPLDAKTPIGNDTAPTPKELILASICGCSGMDVVAHLKKVKQPPDEFIMEAHADMTTSVPSVFKNIHVVYKTSGQGTPDQVLRAVEESMTKYCGVSAMLVKACPITYEVLHNGQHIGSGEAHFS